MNSTQGAHEFTQRKLERCTWGLERYGFRLSADDSRNRCTTLISNWENPQTLNSETWT